MSVPTVRLLKVIVQPVFIVDDGELIEVPADPVSVPAKAWPDYPTTGFATAFEALKDQIVNAAESRDAASDDTGPTGPSPTD